MRFLTVLLITMLFSGLAFAKMEGGMERTRVSAYGGYGMLNPTGINNYINAQAGSPKENTLSNFFYYGAEIGYMVTHRIELTGEYTQESASNPVNNSVGQNSGVQLSMNAFLAGLNYYLVDSGKIRFSIGAQVGYPNRVHATVIQGSYGQFDSTFAPIFKGLAKIDFMISNRFSIFVNGGYESNMQNTLSNGPTNLTASGSNVNFDMSGARGEAGLSFFF